MNPYREDGACQECLKRKVKSPMDEGTKKILVFAAHVAALCVAVFADIAIGIVVNSRYGDAWAWAVCFPFTLFVVVVGAVTAAVKT
jgi:hypothetical protein